MAEVQRPTPMPPRSFEWTPAHTEGLKRLGGALVQDYQGAMNWLGTNVGENPWVQLAGVVLPFAPKNIRVSALQESIARALDARTQYAWGPDPNPKLFDKLIELARLKGAYPEALYDLNVRRSILQQRTEMAQRATGPERQSMLDEVKALYERHVGELAERLGMLEDMAAQDQSFLNPEAFKKLPKRGPNDPLPTPPKNLPPYPGGK